jgi:hypothetical protein
MPIPLPDDFSPYQPSDKQAPLPKNVEDSLEASLRETTSDSFEGVISYPGKILAAVTGRDAPIEYPNLPELADMPSADVPPFYRRTLPNIQAMLTSDDLGKTEIFQDAFRDDPKWGGAFIDKFGLPIIMWNDIPYYVNKPGFSETDFSTFLGELAKYSPANRFVGGAKTMLGTAGRGALAYPTTEAVSKAGEAIITPRTVAARDESLEEIAGEIGATAAQDITIDAVLPKVLKAAGRTVGAAVEKGGDVTKNLARRAKKFSPFPRITPEIINESRFPLTVGQKYSPIQDPRNKDFTPQLATEDLIRFGNADTTAQETLKNFDRDQMQMIEDAAKDLQNELGVGVVAENYYQIPRAAAEQIQKRVSDLATSKEQEAQLFYNALKEVAEETKPTFGPKSIENITQKMMDYVTVTEGIYPSILTQDDALKPVFDLLKRINRQAKNRKGFEDQTIDQLVRFRNNLGFKISKAKGDDKRILTGLKTQLDEGIDESITAGLVGGDPKFIDDMRAANKLYSEYNSLSGGQVIPALRKLPDAQKAVQKGLLTLSQDGYDTNEVINLLFGKNLLTPRKHMGALIDELQRILPEDEFARVKGLLRDGVMTRAFAGTGGNITRLSITKNFDQVFSNQKDIIERLFTADEIKKVKDLKDDVLPTLAAELRKNASSTAYVTQGFLHSLGLHSVPGFGLTTEARLGRAALEEGAEQLTKRKQKAMVSDMIRGKITEMRTPLLPEDSRNLILGNLTAEEVTQAAARPVMREDEEEQAEAAQQMFPDVGDRAETPDADVQALEERIKQIQSLQNPQSSIDMPIFEDLPTTPAPPMGDPSLLGPSVLPRAADREIAARRSGIAGLV